LQRESRQRRKSMREIAEAILLNDDLRKTRWSLAGQVSEEDSSSGA
jgi:uroporphyrinogen-III synthase